MVDMASLMDDQITGALSRNDELMLERDQLRSIAKALAEALEQVITDGDSQSETQKIIDAALTRYKQLVGEV